MWEELTHLKPVPVVHLLSYIWCVGADGQLYGSSHGKPPPLHSKWHEAGTEHCSSHIHKQVRHMDVWLPVEECGEITSSVNTYSHIAHYL